MMQNPNLAFDALLESLKTNPEEWQLTEYTLTNYSKDVSVWIGNGFTHYGFMHPVQLSFSLCEKFIFSRAFSKWKRGKIEAKFRHS
jgi:hypothetical protein